MKRKSLGAAIRALFGAGLTDEAYEELEDLLVEADLGARTTMQLSDQLRRHGGFKSREELIAALRQLLIDSVTPAPLALEEDRLNVVLVLGVNGVGKTTTIAKIANGLQQGWAAGRVVLAAGDTFRAAAVEQLTHHANRIGVRIVKQSTGADAGAVVHDAITSASTRGDRVVLADTAGRMHNRTDLVRELEKIHGIVRKLTGEAANYRKLLVVDATTGQNAFHQAELFHQAVGVDAIVLSKYDSTARGGILVPIARELGIGCAWVGTGESYGDLYPFEPERYVDELLAL